MRFLAEVEGKQRAESFVAYLITLNIDTHIEPAPKKPELWEVWVRDEDKLPRAQSEFANFTARPDDPKYAAAVNQAREIIKRKQEASQAAAKNIRKVNYRGAAASLTSGRIPPLTLTLLITCIVVSLLSNFTQPEPGSKLASQIVDKLGFVSPRLYVSSGGDAAANLKRGEIWRAVTPIFLHGSVLHLAMNMLGLVALGRVTERLVGTPRYAVMILLLAAIPMMIACMLPRNLDGSPFTVGISGVIYGLVAYLWLLTARRPELGFRIPDGMVGFLLLVVVLGFAGIIPGLSNWGHLMGFLVGLGLAGISSGGR